MKINYRRDDDAIRELGRSARVQAECLSQAQKIARNADSLDRMGRYRAAPATVPSGWEMEDRAGAEVQQTEWSPYVRNRPLKNAIRE